MSQANLDNIKYLAESGFFRRYSQVVSPQLREKIRLNGTSVYNVIIEFKDPVRLTRRVELNRNLVRVLVKQNHPETTSFLENQVGADYEPFGSNEGLITSLSVEQIEALSMVSEIRRVCWSSFSIEKVRDYYETLKKESASSSAK